MGRLPQKKQVLTAVPPGTELLSAPSRPQGAGRGRAAAAEEDGGPRGAGSGAGPRRTHRERACAGAAPADLPPAETRTRRSAAECRADWRWRPPGPPLRRSSLPLSTHGHGTNRARPPAEEAVPPTRWPPRTATRGAVLRPGPACCRGAGGRRLF